MSALNGAQLRGLNEALLSAFPDYSDLARLVRFGLDENLAAISGAGSLSHVTFELITWADSRGLLRELVQAARAENPGNVKLQKLAATLFPENEAPVPPDAQPSPGSAASAYSLIDVMALLFPRGTDASRLCADAGIDRARIDFHGAALVVWQRVLAEAERSRRLSALLAVARREFPANSDLQAASRALVTTTLRSDGDGPVLEDQQLYDRVVQLLPAQFETVIFRLGVPIAYLSSASAPQATRAVELVRYLRDAGELGRLQTELDRMLGAR